MTKLGHPNRCYVPTDSPIRHVQFHVPRHHHSSSPPASSIISINEEEQGGGNHNNNHNNNDDDDAPYRENGREAAVYDMPSEFSPLLRKPKTTQNHHKSKNNSSSDRDGDEESNYVTDDDDDDEENVKYMEDDYDAIQGFPVRTTWVKETKFLVASSAPLVVTFLLQNSINLASIFAVGRMGKVELSAVSLAITTLNITFIAPAQGLASGLDTACAQAFGNRRYHLVGLQCQRVTLLCLLLSFPVALLWFFSEPVLSHIVTDPRSAHLTALFLRVMILSMPGVIVFETGKRLLQAQGLFRATTYILLVSAPVNVFLNWLLIIRLGWGFLGAPVAVMLTRNLLPLLLVCYVRFASRDGDGEGAGRCWGGLSVRALANWGPMMRLAVPSMVMVEAEFLAFEAITLLCSTFGTGYLASWGIVASLNTVSWQAPFAMSIAASSRIANFIGAGAPEAAKVTARMAFLGTCLVSIIMLTIYVAARYHLPHLFTSNAGVIALTAKVLPYAAVTQFFDGISTGAHGLLRGLGRQSVGGAANLFSYYIVSLPVSVLLGVKMGWKLEGFSSGLTVGLVSVSLIEYIYILKMDWNQATKEAEARNAEG
ncbi:MATE efflux family protein [Xylariaceae sp. FL0594]|nr:MATE efflux family protein [Xylariaceae sp. FL0594]